MTRQLDELMLLYTMGNKLEDFILVGNCTKEKLSVAFSSKARSLELMLLCYSLRRSFETKLQDSLGFNECDLSLIWMFVIWFYLGWG